MSNINVAIIAGATGLVGSELLAQIKNKGNYAVVLCLTRKGNQLKFPEGLQAECLEVNWTELENSKADLQQKLQEFGPEVKSDWFCALGTTINKAGSREAFRQVDYEAVFRLACLSQELRGQQFLVVSAMGADSRSSVFYNRVKGEMESALWDLGMQNLFIFRPSLLLGDRQEKRLGEKLLIQIAPLLAPFLVGPLVAYRPIQAKRVAEAMLAVATSELLGPQIFLSQQIENYPALLS